MENLVLVLPHVNASLNGLACCLLVVGYWLIKTAEKANRAERERLHRNVMLACFGVSVVFLICYLTYHFNIEGGSKKFPSYPPVAVIYTYYAILLTHIILAAAVPFLAIATIYFGLTEQRVRHRFWAFWTFPIWLYVSITGVVVYFMLYHFFPPQ